QANNLKPGPLPLQAWTKPRQPRRRWYSRCVAPVWQQLPRASQRWLGGVRAIPAPARADDANTPIRGYQLYFHGSHDRLWTRCFSRPPLAADCLAAFRALAADGPAGLIFHGAALHYSDAINDWLQAQSAFWLLLVPPRQPPRHALQQAHDTHTQSCLQREHP